MRYVWILIGAVAVAAGGCQSSNTQYGLTGDKPDTYTNPRTYNTDDGQSWDKSMEIGSEDICQPSDTPK